KGITNIILTESPIDALSYFQLKGERFPVKNTMYVAFGGTIGEGQLDTVHAIVTNNANKKNNINFVAAVDNDAMGKSYNGKFRLKFDNVVEDFPMRKDYNDDLKASPKAYKAYNYPIRR